MQWSLLQHVGSSISLTSNTSSSCWPLTAWRSADLNYRFPSWFMCVYLPAVQRYITHSHLSAAPVVCVLSCQGHRNFIDKNWQQVWCVQRSVGNIRISCWMFLCSVLCVGYWSRSRESRYCSERPATIITVLDFWLVTFWQIYVTIVEIFNVVSDFWALL